MHRLRRMGKALGGRAPELGVAGGAGEEEEFGGGWVLWILLEGDEVGCIEQGRQGCALSTLLTLLTQAA